MIKTTLIDFLRFIIKPNDGQIKVTAKSKLLITLILFFLNGLITIIIIIPVLTLVTEILNLSNNNDVYLTLPKAFFFLVILIPLIEELVFRFFLRYNGIKTLIINQKKWLRIFPSLVYGSTICFGLIHLTNFPNPPKIFFFIFPLIILPQLIGGLIISYLRVRLNFLWGVLFHCTWNLIVMIVIPCFNYSLTDAYSDKTLNYNIIIEYKLFFDEEKQKLRIDSIGDKITLINAEHYSIQDILDTLYRKKKYAVNDELLNLNFESKEGVTKDTLQKIIQKELEIE